MSTSFLIKKPSPGPSVQIIKKDSSGAIIFDKVCAYADYVEVVLNNSDEIIECRLIEKAKKAPAVTKAVKDAQKAVKDFNDVKAKTKEVSDAQIIEASKSDAATKVLEGKLIAPKSAVPVLEANPAIGNKS